MQIHEGNDLEFFTASPIASLLFISIALDVLWPPVSVFIRVRRVTRTREA
ncbi:hypothetical protein [Marinobacterium lutimaris]|nr:hypothetical protein [Marinobacterium lutimaris]